MLRRAVLGLALLLAIIGDSSGQSPPEPPRQDSDGGQQRTTPEQRNTDQAPPSAIKILPPNQAQQKPTCDEQKGPENPSYAWTLSDKIAAIASIVALLQFFALVGTVFVLIWTARRQLRAYIGFIGHRLNSEKTELTIIVKNGGQTPAHGVIGWLNWQWYPAGQQMPDAFDFPDYGNPKGSGQVFISPGQETPWSFAIDPQKLEQLRVGQITLYVYGHFDYFDIFAIKRISTFCYEGVSFGDGRAAFRSFNRHNESK